MIMSEEKKLVINATADKAGELVCRLGNDVIVLQDHSTGLFTTNDIDEFCKYVKEDRSNESQGCMVFFDGKTATYCKEKDIRHDDSCLASCTVESHPALIELSRANGREMDLNQFEKFMNLMKRYALAETLPLADISENLNISKIKNIVRQKDNMGNFLFTFKTESGKDDCRFPRTASFKVPVIRNSITEHVFSFNFYFIYKEFDDKVDIKIKIESPTFVVDVEDIIREIIEDRFCFSEIKFRYGSFKVVQATDAWQHKENTLRNF